MIVDIIDGHLVGVTWTVLIAEQPETAVRFPLGKWSDLSADSLNYTAASLRQYQTSQNHSEKVSVQKIYYQTKIL